MATYIGEMQKLVIGDKEYSLPAGGAGTITKVQTTAGAHTAIDVSSGAASFNVPTKTSHLTNDSGFLTSHQTLYEANLNWGGKDFSAGYSPIDAAMIDVLGANRFAFLKTAGLTIEYSTDGGTSYTDYGATDAQKVGLFSSGQSFYLGKHTSNGSCTTNDRLRVTIDTRAASIYTVLNKIAIYMSTSGATVQVLIEKALQSTPTTFSTHKDWTGISGWSGWNILNISRLTTYGNSAAGQYGRIRFTFRQTAVNTNYTSADISKIMGFGGVGWATPSTMAATGHLYSYDSSQNATFPAKVTATGGFSGALTGNVTGTATGNLTSVQYDSTNAKLTYTKNGSNTDIVTVATLKTALGSMPASDVYSWAKASTKPTYTASEVGAATSDHTHGNITNGGDITATAPTIANGDQIIINDSSASKITNGPTFDGSTTTTALTPKGTWETFLKSYTEQYTGTVTSVGLSSSRGLSISGSPITGSGTITINNTGVLTVEASPSAAGNGTIAVTTGTANGSSTTYVAVKGLAAAAYKGVTDNSSATAVTSSDTNLITARTLYYAGYTKNSGTVTSVGISNATNGGLSVSGSPVTSSGTITVGLASAYGDTKNPYGSKTANYVLAAPNGSAGVPSFRALVAADIPDLSGTYVPVTQSGSESSLLPSTTTITIDPDNTGDVIQCTSTQTTNLSILNMGPWGASLKAGTPGEMGINAKGEICVNTSYHVVELIGNDDNNGYDQIYCQGGEVGLQSFNTDYTSGIQTIITPSVFNIMHATDSSNSSLFNVGEASGVFHVPLYAHGHYDTTTSTISLGKYFASGGITSSGGTAFFSFPTGRVFPSDYEIKSFSCTLLGRAANANGTGYYFIKSSSGGTGAVTFNYKSSFSMYNANNGAKTVTAAMQTVELEGGTNIAVNLIGGDDFFSGSTTIRGYINNQPCIYTLQNIQFTVGPAS